MKRIVNVLLLLVMAVNFSTCVVSARVPKAHWVRGYYFVGPYGDRHWVPGHYR